MKTIPSLLVLATLSTSANADVIAASSSHYALRHEAVSPLAPEVLWNRLVHPETWWSPEHSYSGDSANLSLDLRPGGLWKEEWDGGSVAHGAVLYVNPGEQLRLAAPFGPLQSMAVNVVWTITILPEGTGSKVTFDEVANGSDASNLDKIAGAVDGVKAEAMRRLIAAP
jgi:uncharacterized protein YndB with AHSA1/START domain